MKKYLIIVIVLGIILNSCDGQLDTVPSDSVAADVAFNNEGDFTNAARGMFLAMLDDVNGLYYGGPLQILDNATDNLLLSIEGRQSAQAQHDWTYDDNSAFTNNFMLQGYTVVQNANFILANIDVLEAGAFKNNVMGQALATRALAHFDMVRYYAKIPTQSADAGASLALPYVTVPDITLLPARITVTEFYDNLAADLTTAVGLIGDNGNTQMGKDAAYGTLADVYLHMGQWQNAANAANNVTATVAPRTSFTGIWDDSNDDGVIFKLDNDNVTVVTLGVPYNQTAGGIKSEYVPDFEFFQMYDASDIRQTAYFETSIFEGLNYNHVIKWYSSVSTTALGVVDAKVLRAAEVMLIKAEALAEIGGQDAAALTALDAVRSQRYASFVSGNELGNQLKDAIAKERRLELAFEGTRFSDIKRKGMAVQRSTFGHLADGTGTSAAFLTLPAGDDHFQLPIPVNELNLNPNMEQNPGY